MNDTQIRCFLAAAKYENFTKAAETLFLAQPVLGRHISNLEKELGFTLFERNRKTVKLTENGRLFETFIKHTEFEYKAMLHKVQENLRMESMNIKIGSVDGQRVETYFENELKYIVDHNQFIAVSASYYKNSDILLGALNDGVIDAAITVDDVVKSFQTTLVIKNIRITKGCLIIPRVGKIANKEEITTDDLKELRFIIRSEKDNKTSRDMQIEIANYLGITNFVTAPNIATLTMLVKAGVGITTVPDNQELCFELNMRCIELPVSHSFNEVLVWRKDNNNPAIKEFCAVIDKMGNNNK